MCPHTINPSLMIQNGYSSRNIPSFELFKDVYDRRIKAKKAGDKVTANTLKLVLNTTYGATLNQYNDLYDPLKARSVCISGQLYLLELAEHLMKDIPDLKVVELNTDGIMAEFDDSHYEAVNAIIQEWQDRTHFGLEEEVVDQYYAKDVNNYVEVSNGEVKIKGGYLVRGIAPAGAFNVNNNAVIVAEAIKEYFVNGTDPADTINGCDEIFKFQMIAKAGAKYREAYHIVDGEKQPVQRVNRVYATTDERYGKLFKVKTEDDSTAKIEMLPEHCIIDNTAVDDPNHTKVADIDKTFYIAMARKRINDFLGIKEKKERKPKMATRNASTKAPETPTAPAMDTKSMNIFQKLLKARTMFADEGVKKSGMNPKLEFMYYELKDIVPVATPIFETLGLLPLVRLTNEQAVMELVNVDDPGTSLTFTIPMASWEGNRGVNPLQVMGAAVTYYRRYLYLVALDICEADEIDNKGRNGLEDAPTPDQMPEPAPAPAPAPKPPASTSERAEIAKELTDADGMADELQLKQLKKACKALKDKAAKLPMFTKPTEEWLAAVAVQTEGFTKITKTYCAKFLEKIAEKMEEMNNG